MEAAPRSLVSPDILSFPSLFPSSLLPGRQAGGGGGCGEGREGGATLRLISSTVVAEAVAVAYAVSRGGGKTDKLHAWCVPHTTSDSFQKPHSSSITSNFNIPSWLTFVAPSIKLFHPSLASHFLFCYPAGAWFFVCMIEM